MQNFAAVVRRTRDPDVDSVQVVHTRVVTKQRNLVLAKAAMCCGLPAGKGNRRIDGTDSLFHQALRGFGL